LLQPESEYIDLAAVGRLLEDLGHLEQAAALYEACLQAELPEEIFHDTLLHLSLLHKRNGNYPAAILLWEQAASRRRLYAYEELAKYYEHHAENLEAALRWTQEALDYLDGEGLAASEKLQWKNEFLHRMERLQRKLGVHGETSDS